MERWVRAGSQKALHASLRCRLVRGHWGPLEVSEACEHGCLTDAAAAAVTMGGEVGGWESTGTVHAGMAGREEQSQRGCQDGELGARMEPS